MTNTELKQLRKLLFLEISEASKYIGKCDPRTWQRWEKGDRTISQKTINEMKKLALARHDAVINPENKNKPLYQYFDTYEKFKSKTSGTIVQWRLGQSIASEWLYNDRKQKGTNTCQSH